MQPQYYGNRTMARTSGAVWLLLKQLDLCVKWCGDKPNVVISVAMAMTLCIHWLSITESALQIHGYSVHKLLHKAVLHWSQTFLQWYVPSGPSANTTGFFFSTGGTCALKVKKLKIWCVPLEMSLVASVSSLWILQYHTSDSEEVTWDVVFCV